jgi:hypothetical protein
LQNRKQDFINVVNTNLVVFVHGFAEFQLIMRL